MMNRRTIAALGGCAMLLAACPGEDFTPVYFPQASTDAPVTSVTPPPPSDQTACTIQLTATLCLSIKGEKIAVGDTGKGEDPLCTDTLPPISIDINGTKATMRGELFPDITIESHGLPIPITLNGRGKTDGHANIGEGTLAGGGELTIAHFDLYVTALDSVAKIPDLTLTTGATDTLDDLPSISGSPIGATGDVTLVTATTLGSLFPSADEVLLGASLTASLKGTITPTLDACSGSAGQPTHLEVMKLVLDHQGAEVAIPIPNGNQLEISTGTFIARDPDDVGPQFEATAKFRLKNITEQALTLAIPPVIGPFMIDSPTSLNRKLPPQGTLTVRVLFRPTPHTIKNAGLVSEPLTVADDLFQMTAVAMEQQGQLAIDHLNHQGTVLRKKVEQLLIGELYVPASPQRAYFICEQVLCGGSPLPMACRPCVDLAAETCQLLTINSEGQPIDEVDSECQVTHPRAQEQMVIDFGGSADARLVPQSQIIALRNAGPTPLTIHTIRIEEDAGSHSIDQFLFRPDAIVVADDFADIQRQLTAALQSSGGNDETPAIQITLPPYEPPLRTTQAYLVIGYAPNDLLGSDGREAGVGKKVIDTAALIVEGDGLGARMHLKGTTTIKDIPPLQVFFATGTGRKERPDGSTFAFQGMTTETTDLAVPLYMRVPESASRPIRITGLRIAGPDADRFEILDSAEEIMAKPEADRCSAPMFDADGGITGVQLNLSPVTLAPAGFDMSPGAASIDAMPLLACINFHRDPAEPFSQRQFDAILTITAQQIGSDKKPIRNPDGSIKQSELQIPLLAVISPRQGKMVLRISQTMSSILNSQFPTIASVSHLSELEAQIADGHGSPYDQALTLVSVMLDPFDEATLVNEEDNVVSTPGDGITATMRAIDTRPGPTRTEDPWIEDYVSLTYDATAPEGSRGFFFDYPNIPDGLQTHSLKIFTSTLSYPGPLAPPEEKPEQPSMCENVNPCSLEGQRKFGDGPTEPGKVGVCAYFYVSAGGFESPAFHFPEEQADGTRQDICEVADQPLALNDSTGRYHLDGHIDFDLGLRFFSPTYLHNPNGPLGPVPSLDEVFHMNLTTRPLVPPSDTPGLNLIPETRINLTKQEHKLNLNDATLETPQVCQRNTDNMVIAGETYSSWRYFAPLLSKDKEGRVPAGCPEPSNAFTGGSAFLHGRPIDHATGIFTVVGVSKFSSRDELSFVFKDVMFFIVLNGWLCDPAGSPDQFEGERCFDLQLNARDRAAHITVMEP